MQKTVGLAFSAIVWGGVGMIGAAVMRQEGAAVGPLGVVAMCVCVVMSLGCGLSALWMTARQLVANAPLSRSGQTRQSERDAKRHHDEHAVHCPFCDESDDPS